MNKHLIPEVENKDKSPKGFIDKPILPFMDVINQTKDYDTTSSCSGRIAVFAEKLMEQNGFWLFVSHDPIDRKTELFGELSVVEKDGKNLDNTSVWDRNIENLQTVFFKFEPFILHVAATNVDLGQELLNCVFEAGYRTSGLIHGKKRCMIQIKDTLKLDSPIGFYDPNLKILYLSVDREYIEYLVDLSNEKFKQNTKKLAKLLEKIKEFTVVKYQS